MEAVRQQALESHSGGAVKYQDLIRRHLRGIAAVRRPRLAFQIEPPGIDPAGTAEDLLIRDVICNLDEESQSTVSNRQASSRREVHF